MWGVGEISARNILFTVVNKISQPCLAPRFTNLGPAPAFRFSHTTATRQLFLPHIKKPANAGFFIWGVGKSVTNYFSVVTEKYSQPRLIMQFYWIAFIPAFDSRSKLQPSSFSTPHNKNPRMGVFILWGVGENRTRVWRICSPQRYHFATTPFRLKIIILTLFLKGIQTGIF